MSVQREILSTPIGPEDLPLIEQVLASVRPVIHADGGELHLVEAAGDTVSLHLGGKCGGCIQQGETLGGIRRMLMHTLGKAVRVIPARQDQSNPH